MIEEMKGISKDEEKTTCPLFPRLHINDTDKGGPRAPPRNKMALYEQLSIPSQRFNSGSASMITFPPNKAGNFLPSSSTQVISNKRTASSISGKPPGSSSHMGERLHMYSSSGDKPCINLDGKSQFTVYQTSSGTGHLSTKAKNYFHHPPNISMPMKLEDLDDYRIRHMKMVGHKLRESPQNNKKGDSSMSNRNRIFENAYSDSVREESPPLDRLTEACEGSVLAVESNSDLIKIPNIQPATSVESGEKMERTIPSVSEGRGCSEEQQFRLIQSDEREEITSALENPAVEPRFGSAICPDSAAALLGTKRFWRARRAIIHQQRIFTFQVFELHRLLKVQKLIMASPDILISDNKPSSKRPFISKLDIQKPNPISAPTPIIPLGIDGKASPLYFHQPPPGNQWLVPVMSPSEGLIYKPISGACPSQQPGFMPMIYNSNDLLSTPYGIPPIGQNTFFPPFGMMPVPSPSASSSAVEQVSPLPKFLSNMTEDSLPNSQKNSCNISNQKTRSISTYIHKDSDLQLSTASSPPSRYDALPLFPTTPTSASSEKRTQVIKVIPHNPKSASESVSRIFKYIQEERMKCD